MPAGMVPWIWGMCSVCSMLPLLLVLCQRMVLVEVLFQMWRESTAAAAVTLPPATSGLTRPPRITEPSAGVDVALEGGDQAHVSA